MKDLDEFRNHLKKRRESYEMILRSMSNDILEYYTMVHMAIVLLNHLIEECKTDEVIDERAEDPDA